MNAPQIKSRKPTGVPPYPLILVEGAPKSGKSYAAAVLSRSERVGQTYWIDLGEGAADEYGAIPGTRYEVIEHDGDWHQILAQVEAVRAEAKRASAAGEPPVVLVIDSMTAVWELLKDWASVRARKQRANAEKLARDPNAEIKVSMNLWNDATARYRRLMTMLLTFPGIVVATAQGKEVAEMDASGRPVEGVKVYKVEGHKTLAYDATVWLRMSLTERPTVIGARSVTTGIRPGKDDPQPVDIGDDVDLLDWLVFDAMQVDPAKAQARDLKSLTGGALTDDERSDEAVAENPQQVRRFKSREEQRDEAKSGLSPEEIARRDALNLVLDAAREANVAPAVVAKEWADAHEGQDIRQATDIGALELLADDLRARVQVAS